METKSLERSYSAAKVRSVLRAYFAPRVADQILRELEEESGPAPAAQPALVTPPTQNDIAKARTRLRRAGLI